MKASKPVIYVRKSGLGRVKRMLRERAKEARLEREYSPAVVRLVTARQLAELSTSDSYLSKKQQAEKRRKENWQRAGWQGPAGMSKTEERVKNMLYEVFGTYVVPIEKVQELVVELMQKRLRRLQKAWRRVEKELSF